MRVNSTELFHVDRRVWTTLKGRDGLQGPRERAFHTASVLGNYMVVYGEEASPIPLACQGPWPTMSCGSLSECPPCPQACQLCLFSYFPRGQCAHPLPGGKVL